MSRELGQRIAFTFGALLVYRIGSYIPIPGIDPSALQQLFRGDGDFWSSMLSGYHGLNRFSLFALDLYPYISAAIIVQLVSLFFSRGDRQRGNRRYVLGLTAVFSALQALGIAFGLESVTGIVSAPGWLFRISTLVSLIGGTFFLIWLSGRITECGVGNGLALLLFVGIAVDLPAGVAGLVDLEQRGVISTDRILGLSVFVAVVVAAVVFMELARRYIPVQYVQKQIGDRVIEGQPSRLSLKINNAGVIPAGLTTWFVSVQPLILDFANRHGPPWLNSLVARFEHGRPAFMILAAILIVFLSLLYTAVLLDPAKGAERLVRYGGIVPGITPGDSTAEFLDHVLSRTAIIGAAYLALLYLLPEILISYWDAPFYFSGISVLILVCTVLDIDTQVRGSGLITARETRQ